MPLKNMVFILGKLSMHLTLRHYNQPNEGALLFQSLLNLILPFQYRRKVEQKQESKSLALILEKLKVHHIQDCPLI